MDDAAHRQILSGVEVQFNAACQLLADAQPVAGVIKFHVFTSDAVLDHVKNMFNEKRIEFETSGYALSLAHSEDGSTTWITLSSNPMNH